MKFLWPQMLWALAAVPALLAAYLYALGRREASLRRKYAGLNLVQEALGGSAGPRRHWPVALMLLGVATMLLAAARPYAVLELLTGNGTVILAIDVSGSMGAEDVAPTRLQAAQAAAKEFVAKQPRGTRIGIVEFSEWAMLVQAPTAMHGSLLAAIDGLKAKEATAIGSAILVSLKAIFPGDAFSVESASAGASAAREAAPIVTRASEQRRTPGGGRSAAIILLTDGENTIDPDPVEAARLAAGEGVRIYTVGIGTESGEVQGNDGWTMRVGIDEGMLRTIAELTGAEYFRADSAPELSRVYGMLTAKLAPEKSGIELTALVTAAGALLLVAAAALSLLWYSRIL